MFGALPQPIAPRAIKKAVLPIFAYYAGLELNSRPTICNYAFECMQSGFPSSKTLLSVDGCAQQLDLLVPPS